MDIEYSNQSEDAAPEGVVPLETVARVWPLDAWEHAVRSFETDALWRWLNDEERRPLLLNIARGFQVAPRVFRQALVKKRLAQHLSREAEIAEFFLQAWRENKAAKSAILAIENLADEAAFGEQRAILEREHGADFIHVAALLQGFTLDASELRVLDVAPQTPIDDKTQAPKIDYERKRLQEQIASLKTRLRASEADSSQAKKRAEILQIETQKSHAERDNLARQNRKRETELQSQHDETRALLDRLSRKHRVLESASEEQLAEKKRLQRLVRQSQKLNEENRRQVAQLSAQIIQRDEKIVALEVQISAPKIAESKSNASASAPQKARPLVAKTKNVVPQEQVFVWNADGREVRVSPREVREAIDRNDETRIYNLVQALDALRENDEELARRFLQSIRDVGRYYNRVLTSATTRVLVDASNVARLEKDARGKGQLRTLLAMRDELRRHDFFPIIVVADASLPHNIDEPQELQRMIARGEIGITPVGVEADDVLARESRRSGAYVVTNDRNFHSRIAPDWEPPRISFKARDGVIELGDW